MGDPAFCREPIAQTVEAFGRLDILVNNAAEQHAYDSLLDITPQQLERTFRTNIFAMFYMVQAALPHMQAGAAIVNTTSVTAYQGHPQLSRTPAPRGRSRPSPARWRAAWRKRASA